MKKILIGLVIGVILTLAWNQATNIFSGNPPDVYRTDLSNSTKITAFCQKNGYDYGITKDTDPSTFSNYNKNSLTDENIICVKTEFNRKTDEFTYKDYFKFRIGDW